MAVRGGRTGGPEIEIGGQLVAHPQHDALAETSNHDSDGGHDGAGCRERADQNGRPAQGRCEAARSKQGFHTEEFAEKYRGKRSESINECGHRQRRGCHEQDRGEIAKQRLAGDGGSTGGRAAAKPSTSANHESRPLCTRTSYSRRPRAIASTGETSEASRAGEYADAAATPTPIASARKMDETFSSMVPGLLLT